MRKKIHKIKTINTWLTSCNMFFNPLLTTINNKVKVSLKWDNVTCLNCKSKKK